MHRILFLYLLLLPAALHAASPSPSLLRAVEKANWAEAHSQANRSDALLSYVRWRFLLDDDAPLDFKALSSFIDKHPDWPRLNALRVRAEKALFVSGSQSHEAERWLNRYEPISGYGMLTLARFSPDANLIRKGWIQGDFSPSAEQEIRRDFGKWLDIKTHEKRAQRLLFDGKTSAAERMLSDVSSAQKALMRARIALQRKERSGIDALVDGVPRSLRSDDGLLADRARWRHRKGLASGARSLLLSMHKNSPYADHLWRMRVSYARDAIEAGNYASAKRLLQSAGNTLSRANNADALWMNGWLHLRFLSKPRKAYEIFGKLYHNVSYPVSKARGAFWSARAAEQNGNAGIAKGWYEQAAKHPTTFYGQLAFATLKPGKKLTLPDAPSANSSAKKRYKNHALWQLARGFYRAGKSKLAAPLVYALGEKAQSAGEFAALMELAKEANLLHARVLIAKLAMRKHIVLADGWPIVHPPADSPLAAELALAIARQESEFNPAAVSRANARGLMQLLPSTARRTAKSLGLGYRLSKLFDPVYNMRLGSAYLSGLIDEFDGNYILAIAGYNAGPGRSRQWVERFGRPGKNLNQTLTFLELIPFAETRNYVQRVLENAQVYRARLDASTTLQIKQDLGR